MFLNIQRLKLQSLSCFRIFFNIMYVFSEIYFKYGLNELFNLYPQVRDEMADESPSEEIIPIHDIDDRWPCRFQFASSPSR